MIINMAEISRFQIIQKKLVEWQCWIQKKLVTLQYYIPSLKIGIVSGVAHVLNSICIEGGVTTMSSLV
jgi:hypothetical protein